MSTEVLAMDWTKVYFGHVSTKEVAEAVSDSKWQTIRKMMKGTSLENKYRTLRNYIDAFLEAERVEVLPEHDIRMAKVRVTNYVTALSRGGLIKPSDYLAK